VRPFTYHRKTGRTSWFQNPQLCEPVVELPRALLDIGGRSCDRVLPLNHLTLRAVGCVCSGCTLDASRRSRHLSIGSTLDELPGHVVLENVILLNGRITASYEGGGAVLVADGSTLKMLECVLANNTAQNSWGGAVHVSRQGHLTVQRTRFISNVALEHGGALYVEGHAVVKDGCSFRNNLASVSGNDVFASHGSFTYSSSTTSVQVRTQRVTLNRGISFVV
jgi:predicted outer membrane repeat protein